MHPGGPNAVAAWRTSNLAVATKDTLSNAGHMKSVRFIRAAVVGLGLAMVASGCGGVNATGSVSPATFFLPGLMKIAPERPAPGQPALPEQASAHRSPEAGQP